MVKFSGRHRWGPMLGTGEPITVAATTVMIVVAGSTSRYPPRCWLAADRRRRRRSSLPSVAVALCPNTIPFNATVDSDPWQGSHHCRSSGPDRALTVIGEPLSGSIPVTIWVNATAVGFAGTGSIDADHHCRLPHRRCWFPLWRVCRRSGVVGPNGWSDWVVWTWLKPLALFIDPTRTGLTRSFFDGFLSFMHGFWPFSNGSMYNWLSSTLYIWMTSN